MDKSLTKQVLQAHSIPQLPYLVFSHEQWQAQTLTCVEQVNNALRWPVFVKPCSQGSSVGVVMACDERELLQAVNVACQYDFHFIIEQAATGYREIECAVLGNDPSRVSVPGEIRPRQGFYDYRAKYQDDSAELVVPAQLNSAQVERVQELAIQVFKAVGAADLARVDFFVDTKNDLFYINEINTMPGFTPISMYPRLWQETGIDYASLIDSLVSLAQSRHRKMSGLRQVL
ncbi:MAG TPA: D-alanine--D-alanine ligase, partial [Gammaproteobacteria bacterium]|nr:D-alanine--D-alanine ligase [Gammaproteobacteria bacterium]